MKILVLGLGYVGTANAVLLSQQNEVICYDINADRINLINDKKSPIEDKLASEFLSQKNLNIKGVSEFPSQNDFDFVSGTRYSKGGKRLGGSLIGSILSRTANKLFNLLSNVPLTDCTTGIKLFKKRVWESIHLESKPIGWAFAFELSIKTYLKGYKITEFPLKSVDRLFGGSSTFKLGPWVKEYLKWFVWGLKTKKDEKK